MENTSDEITIIDAEIEKMEKAIRKALEGYNEVYREASDHFARYNTIPSGTYKETKKVLVDAIRGGGKDLDAYRHTVKALQSRLDTLKQSREVKLNKIVFKEDLEEVEKHRNEARNTASKPRDKPAGATTIPKKLYYDGNKGVLFVGNDSIKLTHTEKVFFEYFWDKEEGVSNDAVIDHMTMFYELKGTTWNIGYFNKTKTGINEKCKVLGVIELIQNVAKKEYKFSIKIKKKICKS